MFKSVSFRPVLLGWITPFRLSSAQNAFVGYGNLGMPDKLYKTVEMEMKSAEPAVLKSYETFILSAARELEITVGKRWFTKPTKKRWTLLKSVFVYRKHMVQYEVRTYYRWIQLHKMTGSTCDTFLEYVERMLPEGVGLKVTKLSIEPLPNHVSKENIKKVLEDSGMQTWEATENVRENYDPEGAQQQQQKA